MSIKSLQGRRDMTLNKNIRKSHKSHNGAWGCRGQTSSLTIIIIESWTNYVQLYLKPITLIILFLVLHFNFLFVPCGRLSWLLVSFLLHVKYTLSYRIVSCLKNTRPLWQAVVSDKRSLNLIIFGRRHQHTFKNDMLIQLFSSFHFYLLYMRFFRHSVVKRCRTGTRKYFTQKLANRWNKLK